MQWPSRSCSSKEDLGDKMTIIPEATIIRQMAEAALDSKGGMIVAKMTTRAPQRPSSSQLTNERNNNLNSKINNKKM